MPTIKVRANGHSEVLIDKKTSTGLGENVFQFVIQSGASAAKSFHGILTGTGALTATVSIEVSNDGVNFFQIDTISLSGTTLAQAGKTLSGQWLYIRGNITALSGTGATVTVLMGV